MLIPTLALTQLYQSELDHRTALAIWNRARNAHGFNTKQQNSLRWVHDSPSAKIALHMSGYDNLYEFTTLPDREMTYTFLVEGYKDSTPFGNYTLRVEFLKHPVGILTSPPETIQKPLSPDAFTLTVKGITIEVYLDPKTDRIDHINYLDPTPGTRKFSNYASYEDYIRPSTLWLPESWQSGPDHEHLGDKFNVIYGINSCRGFSPWIPENFDYKTPDLGGTGF